MASDFRSIGRAGARDRPAGAIDTRAVRAPAKLCSIDTFCDSSIAAFRWSFANTIDLGSDADAIVKIDDVHIAHTDTSAGETCLPIEPGLLVPCMR